MSQNKENELSQAPAIDTTSEHKVENTAGTPHDSAIDPRRFSYSGNQHARESSTSGTPPTSNEPEQSGSSNEEQATPLEERTKSSTAGTQTQESGNTSGICGVRDQESIFHSSAPGSFEPIHPDTQNLVAQAPAKLGELKDAVVATVSAGFDAVGSTITAGAVAASAKIDTDVRPAIGVVVDKVGIAAVATQDNMIEATITARDAVLSRLARASQESDDNPTEAQDGREDSPPDFEVYEGSSTSSGNQGVNPKVVDEVSSSDAQPSISSDSPPHHSSMDLFNGSPH
jgi:hypothetical protein